MAIQRSPFSNQNEDPVSQFASDSSRVSDIARIIGETKSKPAGAPVDKYIPPAGLKTSQYQEEQKLNKAYVTGRNKILVSGLSEKEKKNRLGALDAIYDKGKAPEGLLANTWSEIKHRAGQVFDASSAVARTVQSAFKEIDDLTSFNVGKTRMHVGPGKEVFQFAEMLKTKEQKAKEVAAPPKASWSEFTSQAKNKDFRMVETGRKALDTVIDLGVDIVSDPLTYAGVGEMGLVGKAGRTELMLKFGTKEMLAKYPEMAGLLDDVARYGAAVIPKTVREAENIQLGVRFAGRVVPHTDIIQQAFTGRYGITSNARAFIGDAIDTLGLKNVRVALTPASRAGMVAKSIGRNNGVPDSTIIREIADLTSHRYAKGFKAEQFDKAIHRIKTTLESIRKSESDVAENFYKYVENPALMDMHKVGDDVRGLVNEYRGWQDSLRRDVNSVYEKFNADFGPNSLHEIGYIDDFLHHKITDQALELAYGPKSKFKSWFSESDLSGVELGSATGTALHRKLKLGEKFMGETISLDYDGVTHDSVLDAVNYIFKKKTGTDVEFFSKDIFEIAQSYSYSIASARGREAYFRRMFDFGDDVIKTVGYKYVPDQGLLNSLHGSYSALRKTREALAKTVRKGRVALGDTMDAAVKTATAVLETAYLKPSAKMSKQIDNAVQSLNVLEMKHLDLLAQAAQKNAAERGAFLEMHGAILDDIRATRAALEAGSVNEMAAYDSIKSVWIKTFPDRKTVPKDVHKMIDDINRVRGVADTRQLRELEKRLKGLRQQIAEVPEEDIQQLNELLDLERTIVDNIQGHQRLGQIKIEADYAEDGLVYGFNDALIPHPGGPDAPPYRVMSTNPVGVRLPDGASSDEVVAARNAFMHDPQAVAVHAPSGADIHDMRKVEDFVDFWDPEGPIADAVVYGIDGAGLDTQMLKDAWDELLNDGTIDPMFEQIYPEHAQLLSTISAVFSSEFKTGVVDDMFIENAFNAMHDSLVRVAASAGAPDSDLVATQMFDDIIGYMADTIGKPVLVPDNLMMNTGDGYSLIVPTNWEYKIKGGDLKGSPSSAVHSVPDSEFVKEIMNGDLESAAFASSQALGDVTDRALELEGFKTVQAQAMDATRKIGGMKSAGTRRVKQAEAAYKEWVDSGVIAVSHGGKKVKMSREQALDLLNQKDMFVHTEVAKMEDALARQAGRASKGVQNRIQLQRERIASLMDQASVLERWNDTTGQRLRDEIDLLRESIAVNPATGGGGATSRAWAEKVGRQIKAIDGLNGTVEYEGYKRVFTQLFADEAQLAFMDFQQIPAIEGLINHAQFANLVPDIQKGWTQIKNTGLQVPSEVYDVMFPNVQKLMNKVEAGKFKKAWYKYYQAFKIYATMSLGFVARNAMSAAFMNHVAGVEGGTMIKGIDAMIAYKKFGPEKWLDHLGIVNDKVRAVYEEAMRATHATGRGLSTEFESPILKGGFFDRKVLRNKAVDLLSTSNDFVELSVRFPMALDTLLKGGSYDNAVYRVTRYHFDYSDLSRIDEAAKKNFIPFWVWTTRNIPLQMTEQILRPSTYNIYNKTKEHYPVSSDVMLPAWLSENSPMGLAGNWVFSPDLPMNRLDQQMAQFADPKRLVGQAFPTVKLPVELFIADKQLATDIPFTDKYAKARGVDKLVAGLGNIIGSDTITRKDKDGNLLINPRWSYALNSLIPPLATAQRATGGYLGGKDTYQERQMSSILSWLGIPVREVGTREQRSAAISRQFEIMSQLQDMARKEKGG